MYYVYYDETGYGNYNIREFGSEEEAFKFINENLETNTIKDFRLITGQEIKLEVVEVTTKIARA
jgi:hypothetical protein